MKQKNTDFSSIHDNQVIGMASGALMFFRHPEAYRSVFSKLLIGVFLFSVISFQPVWGKDPGKTHWPPPPAGVLLQWNTWANTGLETTEPSVFNDPNISSANITMGSGITPLADGNAFGGKDWWRTGNSTFSTLAQAIAGNAYFEFTVTPNSGYSFTATKFVFNWDWQNEGPKHVTLRSSNDNYATDLGTITNILQGLQTNLTINISALTNISTTTTFRLYGYGAKKAAGYTHFENNSNIVDVELQGTTICAAPPTPGIPTSNSPQCAGTGVTLTKNGSAPGTETWYWQGTNATGTSTTNNATSTYNAASTGTYYIRSRNNTTGCWSVAAGLAVTVNALPATPGIPTSNSPQCADVGVTLTKNGSVPGAETWYWQGTNVTGTSTTNNATSTYNAASSGTYYIRSRNNTTLCWSVAAGLAVTVNALPATPGIPTSNSPQCAGTGVTLTANGLAPAAETWYWQGINATGTSTTNNATSTYNAASSGTYYIRSRNNTTLCWSTAAGLAVTVNALPATPGIPTSNSQQCADVGVTLTANGLAPGAETWYWQGTNATGTSTLNNATSTYNAASSGTYYIRSRNNTTLCWSVAAGLAVTVNATPATPGIPTSNSPQCAGTGVTLTKNGSAPGTETWYWQGTNVTGTSTLNNATSTYNAASTGTYYIRSKNNTTGCWSVAAGLAVTVNAIPATPTITAGGATTFCAGGSVVLTSNAATGNQWYKNTVLISGQTSTTYTATTSGTYTVISTVSGCPSLASTGTVVTVNPIPATPTITAGGATTFCAGGSVVLTSSAASGNQWYKDNVLLTGQTNITYTATTSGTYTVISTVSGCASLASNGTVVTVNPIPATPTITAGGATTFCTGGSVVLTSSAATGNQWYKNTVLISGQTSTTYTATTSGSYTVISTVSGCPSLASTGTVVTVNPIPATPTITAGGATTFCAGGSVVLTSNAATGNQWYKNAVLLTGETNTTYTATTSGTYTVISTVSGCPSLASTGTVVTVNPIPATPTITAGGATTFCTGGSVVLTSNAATGNQWYKNTVLISGQTSTTYTATTSGSYTVISTVSGCPSLASTGTVVTVNPIPTKPTITTSGATSFCTGGSVTLTSSAATGNQWYKNNVLLTGETNTTYSATTSGTYTVISTVSGCASPASNGTVVTVGTIPPMPTITPASPTTFCSGGRVILTSSAATGNQWYNNNIAIPGQTGTVLYVVAGGSYTVISTVGCTSPASAATLVNVNNCTPCPATDWLGVTSTDWFVASNWSCGVPSSVTDVSIPPIGGTVLYQPVIMGPVPVANSNNLILHPGATLMVANGATYTQTSGGIFTNQGIFTNNGTFNQ